MSWHPHLSHFILLPCYLIFLRTVQVWKSNTDLMEDFSLNRLHSQHHTRIITVNELQYADDDTCLSHSHEKVQHSVNNYSNAYATYDMSINRNKTKLIVQPPHGEDMPLEMLTSSKLSSFLTLGIFFLSRGHPQRM